MERPRRWTLRALATSGVLAVVIGAASWWLGGDGTEPWIERLDRAGILLGFVLACIAAGGGITGLIYLDEIRTWWRRTYGRAETRVGEKFDWADKVQAVILPVSNPQQPSWIIHHAKPDYVALLFSEASREQAFQIEREFAGRTRFEPSVAELERQGRRIEDAHDPRDTKQITGWLIRHYRDELRVPRHRIFVDTTSGTKPMSLGAFQAAEEARVSSIYIRGTRDASKIEDPKNLDDGEPRFMSDWTEPDSTR